MTMEYHGELYGKIGKKYFPIGTTAAEVDEKIKNATKPSKPRRYMLETEIVCVDGKFPKLDKANAPIRTIFMEDIELGGRILAYTYDNPNAFFHADRFRVIHCDDEKDMLESVAGHTDGYIMYAWHGTWEFEYLMNRCVRVLGKTAMKWRSTVSLLEVYKAMFPESESFTMRDAMNRIGMNSMPGFSMFRRLITSVDAMGSVFETLK